MPWHVLSGSQSRTAPQCLFWQYLKWDPQLLQYSLHLGLEHLCWQLPSPNAHLVGEDYQLGTDKDTLETLTTAQPEHYTNTHPPPPKAPHPVALLEKIHTHVPCNPQYPAPGASLESPDTESCSQWEAARTCKSRGLWVPISASSHVPPHLQSLGLVGKTFPERVVMRVPSRSKAATWCHQKTGTAVVSSLTFLTG